MINSVVLVGRTTKDVELRYTQSNKAVASFTLACKGYGEDTDFINCVVWGKSAENMSKYVRKGNLVGIPQGRIKTRTYETNDGSKRYITEVVANSVVFLESKSQESGTSLNVTNNSNNEQMSINKQYNAKDEFEKEFGW